MRKLTQADVLKMSKDQRNQAYEKYVDIGCNTFPDTLENDIAHANQHILEQKIQFNEF
jgi:hypothetical protein